jgi:hypothetical protein
MRATILILLAVLFGCGKEKEAETVKEQQKTVLYKADASTMLTPGEKRALVDYYNSVLASQKAEQQSVVKEWNELRDKYNADQENKLLAVMYYQSFTDGEARHAKLTNDIAGTLLQYKARAEEIGVDRQEIKNPGTYSYGKSFKETADKVKAKFKL